MNRTLKEKLIRKHEEQVIQNLADMLRHNPFTFEFKVKKKPQGIKIIYEVTQEQMNDIVENAAKESREG